MSLWEDMLIEVQIQKSSGHSSTPLIHVWASQIHHIMKRLKMDASEVLTDLPYYIEIHCGEIKPATPLAYDSLYLWHDLNHPDRQNHWWSTDLEGQIPISTTVVEGASNIGFGIYIWSYPIPQQIYPILWDIHQACGFDPESTEMAEYLGYPLLEPRNMSQRLNQMMVLVHPMRRLSLRSRSREDYPKFAVFYLFFGGIKFMIKNDAVP
ncbi:hypothetical protein C8J56DRAFT_900965 [Mycena floridula]|nr:hypothetical protein C8J56DRAFT_900965 [Mycena floridula]